MENRLIIRSRDNQWIELCQKVLAGKREVKNLFFAEGYKVVKSLLPKFKPVALFSSESFFPEVQDFTTDVKIVSDKLWPSLNEVQTPVKLIGLFERPQNNFENLQAAEDLIVLDRIQDPGNLGTLIRTAVAAGWSQIVCVKGTVDPFCPKVVRSTAGALGGMQIFYGVESAQVIQKAKELKLQFVITSSHSEPQSVNWSAIQSPCLVLGNEGAGLSEDFMQLTNVVPVNLPIVNKGCVESLNVSVAGALLLYKLKALI